MPLPDSEIPFGVDVGNLRCPNHRGVESIRRKTCCGGSVSTKAVIQCEKYGEVVVGEQRCDSVCAKKLGNR